MLDKYYGFVYIGLVVVFIFVLCWGACSEGWDAGYKSACIDILHRGVCQFELRKDDKTGEVKWEYLGGKEVPVKAKKEVEKRPNATPHGKTCIKQSCGFTMMSEDITRTRSGGRSRSGTITCFTGCFGKATNAGWKKRKNFRCRLQKMIFSFAMSLFGRWGGCAWSEETKNRKAFSSE